MPAGAPPYVEVYAESLLELQDGSLLLFAFGWTQEFKMRVIEGRCAREGSPWGINMCIRSTDNGQSWSAPANLDGPPYSDENWLLIKGGGGSEISSAQTRDGSIVALIRPFSSPLMWESWSRDGGLSWTPMARGPFAMYACSRSMTSTTSGALIIGGRFPGLGVQVSHDDGMTWQCYRIDSSGWSNGAMFEVEPDVVLFLYGGKFKPRQLRGQFLRVTSTGLEPVR
jgi:hypothetical protein